MYNLGVLQHSDMPVFEIGPQPKGVTHTTADVRTWRVQSDLVSCYRDLPTTQSLLHHLS
jgi:hypothetical protein